MQVKVSRQYQNNLEQQRIKFNTDKMYGSYRTLESVLKLSSFKVMYQIIKIF